MKRVPLILVLVLAFAGIASAVEQSVTYMPLVNSSLFLDRVEFNVIKWIDAPVGGGVGPMLEPVSTPCHSRRIAYARDFLTNPGAHRAEIAKHLITQTVVLSVGTSGVSGSNNFDSAATDAALFSAISASWSAFAACDVSGN